MDDDRRGGGTVLPVFSRASARALGKLGATGAMGGALDTTLGRVSIGGWLALATFGMVGAGGRAALVDLEIIGGGMRATLVALGTAGAGAEYYSLLSI